MKLPIKKEYYDALKNGNKMSEYRDAHITFVCESTGRTLRRDIIGVELIDITKISDLLDILSPNLFDDKVLIEFKLGEVKAEVQEKGCENEK